MRKKYRMIIIILLISFAFIGVGGYAAHDAYVKHKEAEASAEGSETPLDENSLIVLFTNAGTDADGNPVEDRVIIQGSIRSGDLPNYPDKDQAVVITCQNPDLLANCEAALKSMGYTNVVRMEMV